MKEKGKELRNVKLLNNFAIENRDVYQRKKLLRNYCNYLQKYICRDESSITSLT